MLINPRTGKLALAALTMIVALLAGLAVWAAREGKRALFLAQPGATLWCGLALS